MLTVNVNVERQKFYFRETYEKHNIKRLNIYPWSAVDKRRLRPIKNYFEEREALIQILLTHTCCRIFVCKIG